MLDPSIRIRRKVRVLSENVLGRNIFLELYQEAAAADPYMQREENFLVVQFIRFDVVLTWRRHSEVTKCVFKNVAAEAARRAGVTDIAHRRLPLQLAVFDSGLSG
jgi:hypothetical protein